MLWHTCWCSLVVGGGILAVGIVLRSKVIKTGNITLLESSGLFFIIIGGFLVILSPLIALYELINLKQLSGNGISGDSSENSGLPNGHAINSEGGVQMSNADHEYNNDLPTYDDVAKNDQDSSRTSQCSASIRTYPRRLDVDSLSSGSIGPVPPPSYNDIARSGSMQTTLSDKSVATITPSSQIQSRA
ncbi:hypothetical protein RDWZM_005115 [Blomia tropicalis]|uniref:Uncharacterized protein n=1 Tax=Blomia tropicalis TaxID=40697 RepID=A0A9Q0M3E6_BLOTA|nr:hypothetical protein BLOT_005548 [Blomia tropicalis]KAJ6219303.1 hypothetical protein RDWZM_005115 [Blomia tropicalis]